MKFVWALVKISAAVLIFGLLANYLYFAFMHDSSLASGWALGLLLTAVITCMLGYAWMAALQRSRQKTGLDAYIEDVHKTEELLQQSAAEAAVRKNPDEFTPVLEKLVASSAKNTTTLNLAMENLNSRLDELEEKFIRNQLEKERRYPDSINTSTGEKKTTSAVPDAGGNYDEDFADIADLEIMNEKAGVGEYEDIDINEVLGNSAVTRKQDRK